jgi:hypothetical protein
VKEDSDKVLTYDERIVDLMDTSADTSSACAIFSDEPTFTNHWSVENPHWLTKMGKQRK